MAITIDWATKVINVPKADMTLVQSSPTEIRELDINDFRLELKGLEASTEGMSYLDTHSHNPPVNISGFTLARVVEIINGYTVTFEDGQYAVNLVGANSNIADVTNVNQVSIRPFNSAGLVSVEGVLTTLDLMSKRQRNKKKLDKTTGIHTIYDDDGVTVLEQTQAYTDDSFTNTYDATDGVHSEEPI